MAEDIDPEALVIRFSPFSPETAMERAREDFADSGCYRLSVFSAPRIGQETDEAVCAHLLKVTERLFNPTSNKKFMKCARAGNLLDLHFSFHKDGDADELDEHYSVDLGPDLNEQVVKKFLGAFTREVRPK